MTTIAETLPSGETIYRCPESQPVPNVDILTLLFGKRFKGSTPEGLD